MKKILITFIVAIFLATTPLAVFAADDVYCMCNGICQKADSGVCPTNCSGGDYDSNCSPRKITPQKTATPAVTTKSTDGCTTVNGVTTCVLPNPITAGTDIPTIIGMVIKGVLGIIGAISLFMIFFGAWKWQTSLGNPEKVKAGTNTIIWATVGIAVVFASYMILNYIFKGFLGG
jgi:hypothetical protein